MLNFSAPFSFLSTYPAMMHLAKLRSLTMWSKGQIPIFHWKEVTEIMTLAKHPASSQKIPIEFFLCLNSTPMWASFGGGL
jgi:hypothetical protein